MYGTTLDPLPVPGKGTPPDPVGESRELVALIADHVADRHERPRYVTASNDLDGRASTADAAASGRAFAVTPRYDVLAIDADTPTAAAEVRAIVADLAAAGAGVVTDTEHHAAASPTSPVVIAYPSGGPDRWHLWAVGLDPRRRGDLAHRAHAAGADVRAGGWYQPAPQPLRPPGAPHRTGTPSPLDVEHLAAALAALDARQAVERPVEHHRASWRRLLRYGTLPKGHDDRASTRAEHRPEGQRIDGSQVAWLIALGAHRDGWTFDTYRDALADSRNVGGVGYRDRLAEHLAGSRTEHPDEWLRHRVWAKAAELAADSPAFTCPEDAAAFLTDVAAVAAGATWPGTGGATDRLTLAAVLAKAERQGSVVVSMSARELADLIGVGRGTASNSLRRLAASGWLRRLRAGRGVTTRDATGEPTEALNASVYRVTFPAGLVPLVARNPDTGGTPPEVPVEVSGFRAPCLVGGHDAARHGRGFGKVGAEVVADLAKNGASTAREVGARIGRCHRNLGARKLREMAASGVLVRDTEGRYALTADLGATLDVAADTYGTTGMATAQRERHERERTAYREWRAEPERQAARLRRADEHRHAWRHRRTRQSPPLPFAEPARHPIAANAPPATEHYAEEAPAA